MPPSCGGAQSIANVFVPEWHELPRLHLWGAGRRFKRQECCWAVVPVWIWGTPEHCGNADIPFSVQVKAAGTLCRASKNDCDLPEHCTGLSAECPEDVFQENGISCQNGNGYCYNGACPSHGEQCRALWGTGSCSPPSSPMCWGRAWNPRLLGPGRCWAAVPSCIPIRVLWLPTRKRGHYCAISLPRALALCDPFCVSCRGPGGS